MFISKKHTKAQGPNLVTLLLLTLTTDFLALMMCANGCAVFCKPWAVKSEFFKELSFCRTMQWSVAGDWLADKLTDWLADKLTDWLADKLAN